MLFLRSSGARRSREMRAPCGLDVAERVKRCQDAQRIFKDQFQLHSSWKGPVEVFCPQDFKHLRPRHQQALVQAPSEVSLTLNSSSYQP